MTRWVAVVPRNGHGLEAGDILVGSTVTIAPERIEHIIHITDDGPVYTPVEFTHPRTGVIRFITIRNSGHYAITCDDTEATRRCARCDNEIPGDLWRGDDHGVLIQGPLSVDSVAVDADGGSVRFRTNHPYLIIMCSHFVRSLTDLRIGPETDGSRPPPRV